MVRIFLLFTAVFFFVLPCIAANLELIERADKLIKNRSYTRIDSMLIFQNNSFIIESYYRGFDKNYQHRTHSTFKGITALLALKAIDEKLLTTEEFMLPLLSRYAVPRDKDERRERIRIQHLLDMTSGLDCDEAPNGLGPSHEWGVDEGLQPLKYALNIPMAREPSREWHYCSANSFLLAASISAALERAGKSDIFTFAQEHLFTPLKISSDDYRLRRSPDGKFLMGQGNSNFKSKDLIKFGALILNQGNWQNKSVLSKLSINRILMAKESINWSWVEQLSEHPSVRTRYSSHWYQTDFEVRGKKINTIHSWGNGGQFIFVMPELDAVVVFTGSNQGSKRFIKQKQPFEIMHRFILPDLLKNIEDVN